MPARSETSRIIATGIPFAQIPHDCTLDMGVTNAAYRVYALLMKLAETDGHAWPGHRYIASVLPMTRPTAKKALTNLELNGWITVVRSSQAHQYYVHGEVQRLPFTTGKETSPVKNLDHTGKESSHQLVKKLDPIDNQDKQPDNNNQITVVAETRNYRTLMKNALVAAMDWHAAEVTKPQWGRIEKAAQQLCDIDADPADVARRALVYRVNMSGATMTPNAIATNWADLDTPRTSLSRNDVARAETAAAMKELR